MEKIEFIATLAPNSAIAFNGDGDARIKFEAPGSEIANVAALLGMLTDKTLKVTVEVLPE